MSAARILIYSHDTFGLGHLRRCRTIAHALVASREDLSVLIISGSPIIGRFEFRSRVDFVRIPGVIKLRGGDYTSMSLPLGIDETVKIRASIIEHTAKIFTPDMMIVDKEPLGLRGEIQPSLSYLKQRGTKLVLGLRDVMDDPNILREEWQRKNALPALEEYYDQLWVYGPSYMTNPLQGIEMPKSVREKIRYTGYLRRSRIKLAQNIEKPFGETPFILVSPGGGGDGAELVDWVIRAYESQSAPLFPALIVLGPFLPQAQAEAFKERAARLRDVEIIRFTSNLEQYMQASTAVVGMGGYNTFCEILSYDKPALLVPRIQPRREQAIRAEQAKTLGLVQVLPIDSYPEVSPMVAALRQLPAAPHPSRFNSSMMLTGLERVQELSKELLDTKVHDKGIVEPQKPHRAKASSEQLIHFPPSSLPPRAKE
ncbi:glycosyltransferase family protein [Polycladidibacter stylochi]|uniref:glycosyltransferase family protein n=1 Tax=Polycladidibacter stylochi TaxID=1807766 RepID=UPI000B24A368